MQLDSYQIMQWVYNESKFWVAFAGAIITGYRAVAWVKAIKTNDLHHIQLGLDENSALVRGVRDELKEQTTSLVSELREMRQDIRTFYPRPRTPRTPLKAAPRKPRKKT